MKILFALPGLHRVQRGAEIAFIAVAEQLVKMGEDVTLVGAGPGRAGTAYRYIHLDAPHREPFEKWPKLPFFRNETAWEDLGFSFNLLRKVDLGQFDISVCCSFPFVNLALRWGRANGTPAQVFVTQNGDWPAYSNRSEYRLFDCDGLVCINPDYLERNRARYRSVLIPNGVDTARFTPGKAERRRLGLPENVPLVLMVSAMIASKNIDEAIKAMGPIADAHLVVAGDGPEREKLAALAAQRIPGRFHRIRVAPDDMPSLYRSADCFLHLSRDESFGNVYVEALACGLRPVAYDLPRTRWILGETGNYVPDGTPGALTKALKKILGEPNVSQRALLGRAAGFAWPEIARQYRDFFREIVDGNPECSGRVGAA